MSPHPNVPSLFLTKDTFVCYTDDSLVFLQLNADEYYCIEPGLSRFIAPQLGYSTSNIGSPPDNLETSQSKDEKGSLDDRLQEIIDAGLATRDPREGKVAEFIPQASELKELLGCDIDASPKVRIDHVFFFFKSFAISLYLRRFSSMEKTIKRIKARKAKALRNRAKEPGRAYIGETVEVFKILRPLVATIRDQCLFNSLFLIEFLSCYRIYPTWFFGVKLNDFTAHCWVQGGDTIYDDFIAHTFTHKPIMTA